MTEMLAVRDGGAVAGKGDPVDLEPFCGTALARVEEARSRYLARPDVTPSFGGALIPAGEKIVRNYSEGHLPHDILPFKELPNMQIGVGSLNMTGPENERYLRDIPVIHPVSHQLGYGMWYNYWSGRPERAYVESRPSGWYRSDIVSRGRFWLDLPKRPDPKRVGLTEYDRDKGTVKVRLGVRRGLVPNDDDIAVAIEECGSGNNRFSRAVWHELCVPYLDKHDVPEDTPVAWAARRLQILWGIGYYACSFDGANPRDLEGVMCEMASRAFNADSNDLIEPREFAYGGSEDAYLRPVRTRLSSGMSPELMVFLLENREEISDGGELKVGDSGSAEREAPGVFRFLIAFDTLVENGLHVDRLSALYRTFCGRRIGQPLHKALELVYYIYGGDSEEKRPWWFCENVDLVDCFFDKDAKGIRTHDGQFQVGVCDRGVDLVIEIAKHGRFATSEAVKLYKTSGVSFLKQFDPKKDSSAISLPDVSAAVAFAGTVARSFSVGNEDRGRAVFQLVERIAPRDRRHEFLRELSPFVERQKPGSFVTAMLRGSEHGISFPGMAQYRQRVDRGEVSGEPAADFLQQVGDSFSVHASRPSIGVYADLSVNSFGEIDGYPGVNEMLYVYNLMVERVGAENADTVLKVFCGSLAHVCHPLMVGLPEAILRVMEMSQYNFDAEYRLFAPSDDMGFSSFVPDARAFNGAVIVEGIFGSLFAAYRRGLIRLEQLQDIMCVVGYRDTRSLGDAHHYDAGRDNAWRMFNKLELFGRLYKVMQPLEEVGAVTAECANELLGKACSRIAERDDCVPGLLHIHKSFWEHLVKLCRLGVVAVPFNNEALDEFVSNPKAASLANSEWRKLPRGDINYTRFFEGCDPVAFDGTEASVQGVLRILDDRKEELDCIERFTWYSTQGDRTSGLVQLYESGSPKFGLILRILGAKYAKAIMIDLVSWHLSRWCVKGDIAACEAFIGALPDDGCVQKRDLFAVLHDRLSQDAALVRQFLTGCDLFDFERFVDVAAGFDFKREDFLIPFCENAVYVASQDQFPDEFMRRFCSDDVDLRLALHRLRTLRRDVEPLITCLCDSGEVAKAFLWGKYDLEDTLAVFEEFDVSRDTPLQRLKNSAGKVVSGNQFFHSEFADRFLSRGGLDLRAALVNVQTLGMDCWPFVKAICSDRRVMFGRLSGEFDWDSFVRIVDGFGLSMPSIAVAFDEALVGAVASGSYRRELVEAFLNERFSLDTLLRAIRVSGRDPAAVMANVYDPERVVEWCGCGDAAQLRRAGRVLGFMEQSGLDTVGLRQRLVPALAGFLLAGGCTDMRSGADGFSTDDARSSSAAAAGLVTRIGASVGALHDMVMGEREVRRRLVGDSPLLLHGGLMPPALALSRVNFGGRLLDASSVSSLIQQFRRDQKAHVEHFRQATREARIRTIGLYATGFKLHLYEGERFDEGLIGRLSTMPGFSKTGGFKLDNASTCLVGAAFPSAYEVELILRWLGVLGLLSPENPRGEFQLTGPYELDDAHVAYLMTSLLLGTEHHLRVNARSFRTVGYNKNLGRIALQSGGFQPFRFPYQGFSAKDRYTNIGRTDALGNCDIGNVPIFQLIHTLMVHHQYCGPLSGIARWFMSEMRALLHSYKGVDLTTLHSSIDGVTELDGFNRDAFFAQMRELQMGCGGGLDVILDGPWIGGDRSNVRDFAHHMVYVGACHAAYKDPDCDLPDKVRELVDAARAKIRPFQVGLLVGAGYRAGDDNEVLRYANSSDPIERDLFAEGCSPVYVPETRALLDI